jgi:uncharacterized protein (DUF1330 family)
MAAYVIAELGASEPQYRRIARLDKTSRGRFGERMLVDSSRTETLAGDWAPQRIVVLEFPDIEAAQSWWAARQRTAPQQVANVRREMILVDGLA